jgi:DNA-binding transcriptional ArsR family regulator
VHSFSACKADAVTPVEPPARTVSQLDERAIRVLAHPLRSRLLGRLRLRGAATATELAAALQTNTGATSYHLRALESVGLVTDTGQGAGRRRVWRAATDFHSWTKADFADDEDALTALDWIQRDYIRQFAHRAEEWLDAQDAWSADWVDAAGLGDDVITVTPAHVKELEQEVAALLDRYRTRGVGDATAERVHVFYHLSPVELRR